MLRGGSCRNNASNCRSANRNRNNPGNRNDNNGFRPVARQHKTTKRHGCFVPACFPAPGTGTETGCPQGRQASRHW
ncbi:MAG: hypothetical protein IJS32_03710 [Kiritimatiellae bacterium]|nr:hypothetical protein [Kiritimatiellia bacterium]